MTARRTLQKPTEQELVCFNFIRTQYDMKSKVPVPYSLKLLTTQFAERITGCSMLTIKQDLDFYEMIKDAIPFPINEFRLRFRASEHNFSSLKFHEIFQNNIDLTANVIMIRSKIGNIFGGLTSLPWKCNVSPYTWQGYIDKHAVLFMIKNDDEEIQQHLPLLFHQKHPGVIDAVCCHENSGPVFGNIWDCHIGHECDKQINLAGDAWDRGTPPWEFVIRCADNLEASIQPHWQSVNWSGLRNFENKHHPEIKSICGGNRVRYYEWEDGFTDKVEFYLFDVDEYEVFEVVKQID